MIDYLKQKIIQKKKLDNKTNISREANDMEINLDGAQWRIGEYSIAGNYDDGYTVWKTDDGEDSDTLYDNIDFEKCVVWCLNS